MSTEATTPELPEGYTKQEFALLSPDEQAALREEIDDKNPTQVVEEEEAKKIADAKVKTDADATAAKAKADEDAAAKAKETEGAVAGKETTAAEVQTAEGAVPDATDPRPLIPTLKASKIISDDEHSQSQAALAKKFEDGEITTPQFIIENDRLSRAKLESDLATRSSAQNDELAWQARQDAFFSVPGNEIIRDDPRVWAAMQAQLEQMYADTKFKDYSDMQFLNDAGREVRKLFGLEAAPAAAKPAAAPAKPAAKPAGTAVDAPTTLAEAPTAADNADQSNEFANLDALEGMEYEMAIAKLSPEQRTRYLAI